MDKVIVLTGPTAVGKTKYSLELAKFLETDIINGDAYQIYQGLDIGTSKPTIAERQMVNHLLFDFQNPLESFSVFEYQKKVRGMISQQIQKAKIPFIVGGSGLYINSVIYDYQFPANPRDEIFEGSYRKYSNDELYKLLTDIDQALAEKTHPHNRKRVLRSLEIGLNKQDGLNRENEKVPHYEALIFFLNDNRAALYQRINQRVDKMVLDGLEAEVRSLYPNKIGSQALAAIGYKEFAKYLDGEISLNDAINLIKQHTRNYAKRQITWFKHKTKAIWIDLEGKTEAEVLKELKEKSLEFLKSS